MHICELPMTIGEKRELAHTRSRPKQGNKRENYTDGRKLSIKRALVSPLIQPDAHPLIVDWLEIGQGLACSESVGRAVYKFRFA